MFLKYSGLVEKKIKDYMFYCVRGRVQTTQIKYGIILTPFLDPFIE